MYSLKKINLSAIRSYLKEIYDYVESNSYSDFCVCITIYFFFVIILQFCSTTPKSRISVGYPGIGDIPKEKGVGYYQPSFTDGKVSAQKYVNGALVLQISAPITHGNSGDPVINDKGEVVGISTFAYGEQPGFGFIVASNTIKDYLKQAGIRNEEGLVTQRYREALKLYNSGQCKQAMQEFTGIHNLFPQYPSLDKYKHSLRRLISKTVFLTRN